MWIILLCGVIVVQTLIVLAFALRLVPALTVVENISLALPLRGVRFARKALVRDIRAASEQFGHTGVTSTTLSRSVMRI